LHRLKDALNQSGGFFCSLMPLPRELQAISDRNLQTCQYLATLAWIGSKPGKELLEKSTMISSKTVSGNVAILLKNKEGIATTGVIDPKRGNEKMEKLGPNVKIWFDRKNFYLYGACLANVDLALILKGSHPCMVHTELKPVSEEVRKFASP